MKKLLLSLLFVFFVTALVIAQNKNEKFVEKSMNRVDLLSINCTNLNMIAQKICKQITENITKITDLQNIYYTDLFIFI